MQKNVQERNVFRDNGRAINLEYNPVTCLRLWNRSQESEVNDNSPNGTGTPSGFAATVTVHWKLVESRVSDALDLFPGVAARRERARHILRFAGRRLPAAACGKNRVVFMLD